jgi:hypothetical protein
MSKIWRFEFDPFDYAKVTKPKGKKLSAILDEVADLVKESVLLDIGNSRSPVNGRSFKSLSPDYRKEKEAKGGSGKADLELSGSMLDALTVKKTSNGKLQILVDDPSQQGKVDGHNNFTGQSKLPERKFIPDESEDFRPAIRKKIKTLIDERG